MRTGVRTWSSAAGGGENHTAVARSVVLHTRCGYNRPHTTDARPHCGDYGGASQLLAAFEQQKSKSTTAKAMGQLDRVVGNTEASEGRDLRITTLGKGASSP